MMMDAALTDIIHHSANTQEMHTNAPLTKIPLAGLSKHQCPSRVYF